MKRGLTLAFTVTVVFALGLHDIVSAESSGVWTDAELIYIGELRGSHFAAVTYSDDETKYEGIMDIQGGYALEPSSSIIVTEGQDAGDDNIQYYGGKDTGVFWIDDIRTDKVAFLDVQSGYFSGFLFSASQDPWFDDPGTDFLRVTEDGKTYAYINRCLEMISTSNI